MATQEKLQKSLDLLRNLVANPIQDVSKKKEKIYHCHVITEAISNPSIKVATNLHNLLSGTVELLLKLCDDQESDVRMTSEESLNKVIRASTNGSVGKIQIELHKEIKRNGAARSVRAALWRFSQLAHLIRTNKGRAYVDSLFPSLRKITERDEEQVHETLANSIEKIMKFLGSFSSENEIKLLLKSFLRNITHKSASIRRSNASCMLHVCANCKKPSWYISYSLSSMLDMLVPLNKMTSTTTVLGVLNGIKTLLPHLRDTKGYEENIGGSGKNKNIEVSLERLLQIYELCLYYVTNTDHNIVNASMEALNVLLLNCTPELKAALLSKNGLDKTRIHVQINSMRMRSPSQLSIATNITTATDDNLLTESELTETLNTDIQKWIDQSQLSVMNVAYTRSKDVDKLLEKSPSLDTSQNLDDGLDFNNLSKFTDSYSSTLKSQSVCDNLDRLTISENSSEKSSCVEEKILNTEADFFNVDIGDVLDHDESILYCARLIMKSFLLTGNPGGIISDKISRVSVKSLAITCLSTLVTLQPNVLLRYLDKNCPADQSTNVHVSRQEMSDVFLYSQHLDPQLRGNVRLLINNFIKFVIIESNGNYNGWMGEKVDVLRMDKLVDILVEGLNDESSNCCRQSINSLNVSLRYILESRNSKSAVAILNTLPSLAQNPYWLVKVALIDLVCQLSYVTIYYILKDNDFQNKVIQNVLLDMLGDKDQRVRHAAAKGIVRIIPNLYSDQFHKESITTTIAIYQKNKHLSNLFEAHNDINLNRKHFVENMPFPYDKILEKGCDSIEFTLSKIINKLYKLMLTSTSKFFIFGCLETLSLISKKYPSTVYSKAWTVPDKLSDECVTPDMLNFCVNLLTNSVISYDVLCHVHLLDLTANVFAGQSVSVIKPIPTDENSSQLWEMFGSAQYTDLCESYLHHIVKLLNIFHHVLNDLVPNNSQLKTVGGTLPSATNWSPIKRRKSDLDKRMLTVKLTEKEEKIERNSKIYAFAHLPHYWRFYDIVKNSYSNFKVSLDSEACERFLELMKNVLRSLSVLMEIGGLIEFSRIAEDLLSYLKSTFVLDPTSTVECVQQMLKCMFSTNLTANVIGILHPKRKDDEDSDDEEVGGFYYHMAQKPYNDISKCINALNTINKIECDGDSTLMGYLHRKDVKLATTLSRTSDKILGSYIRIFEPMVIKSLKQYTITSDVKLQRQVLQLLSQLVVQLRVNYCLLDSEQVFIGFVLKQFEFIEEGQIPCAEELIPKIFQFLVQLSYSKQHSKSIIGIPKIIQLCDGLLASGQSPIGHCIPALDPIVEDIFLTRNKSNTSDMKELETTREVVLSILLKLAHYHEIVNFLVLILEDSKYCLDDPERWLRWSELILNAIMPLLAQNKIRLDNREAFNSMRRFVFAVNPNAFQEMDNVLVMLFSETPVEGSDDEISGWLTKIIILLLILSPMKEDTLIAKINQLKANFAPSSIFENVVPTADPLNVTNSANIFQGLSPESIFIKFIFRVIHVVSKRCRFVSETDTRSFLIEQFSVFLMHCLHIFQSGSHCKITNVAICLINKNIPFDENDAHQLGTINESFSRLAIFHPILTFQWCYLLTLLNYKNKDFWSLILTDGDERCCGTEDNCANLQITRMGALIVFCDYLIENVPDSSQLTWILDNNVHLIVKLYIESPVSEFIYSLHRNPSTSNLLINTLKKSCINTLDGNFVGTVLNCIKNSHTSQSGTVLHFLLTNLINCQEVAISRNVAYLASRKIDFLLTLSVTEVNGQLDKDQLMEIKRFLMANNLIKKHETLISLLNKLSTQFYELSPIELDQRRSVNPEQIKTLQVDKSWFLGQIKGRCDDSMLGNETARLLNHLEYTETSGFMSGQYFNKTCLKDCIRVGISEMKQKKLMEEPPLLKASAECLFNDVRGICDLIPKPHQVYNPINGIPTTSELVYSGKMTDLFKNMEVARLFSSLAPSVSIYIKSLPLFTNLKIPDASMEDLVKFGVVSLELMNFLITTRKSDLNISLLDSVLECTEQIFKESHLCGILALDSHLSWLCSAINSVYMLVNHLLLNEEPLPSIPKYSLKLALDDVETSSAGQACNQLYILVSWLDKIKKTEVKIPKFLLTNIRSIVVSLARKPLVNSYVLIPTRVWKTGWQPEMSGRFNTLVPPLPIELLQEGDILEEYIFRITLLGWTSRQQFEETWMCLLSVLCNPIKNVEEDELNDIVHGTSLAIKAITFLLLKTLYVPTPGNSLDSKLTSVSRNVAINEQTTSVKKLRTIHDDMQHKYNDLSITDGEVGLINVFVPRNFEKLDDKFRFCQLSTRYFLIATNIIEECREDDAAGRSFMIRTKTLEDHGLDLNSCLQFLLDYYSQIMKSEVASHVRVLYEAVKSTVIISDLFTEKSQFQWMLDTFLELYKNHMIEDDMVHQYLIMGICKASSILVPDLEVFETVKKLMQNLKSPFIPLRNACLVGLLYLLEGCKLSNITIGGISEEMQLILPGVVEYVQLNLNSSNSVLKNSLDHMMLVWSIAFYLIENVDEAHIELNFVHSTIQTAFVILQGKPASILNKAIIKGLERLIIVKKDIKEKYGKQILKLALGRMKHDNPNSALLGTQLLITYMYTDCADHLENSAKFEANQTNPDHLVQTIEKISAMFERIKKGYECEVEMLSYVLPNILDDFFAPSDILTKVIGEFLSPQQPHPKLLSKVVFEVFGSAIRRDQLSLLQDWVVFSLSNFTQSFSIGLATWCLTCFFISASTNQWLRAVFPYVQTRVGRYEYEDRKMLCIAGSDFYNNLTNGKQKETFIENFKKVKDKADTPFNDLLNSL